MGDSKSIQKFMRLFEECEKEHVYQGKIDDFIKVVDGQKKRGMIVTGKTGSHRVEFASGQKKYIKDASTFNIGDEVIVLGKKNHSLPDTTLPLIILVPEEEEVILSQETLGIKFHGWVDYVHVLFYILSSVFGVFFLFWDFFHSVIDESFYFFRFLLNWSGYGLLLTFLVYIPVNAYIRNKYRESDILCDTNTWNIIQKVTTERFGVAIEPPM